MRVPLRRREIEIAEICEESPSESPAQSFPAEGVTFVEMTPNKLKELLQRFNSGSLVPAVFHTATNTLQTYPVSPQTN